MTQPILLERIDLRRRAWRSLVRFTPVVALALLCAGCPTTGPTDGTTPEDPTGLILNVNSNIRVSGDQSVTIVYSAAPTDAVVDAFYIEVDSTDADASTVGPQVVFGSNLTTGENQTVALATGPLPLGIYRVGLDITANSKTLRVTSQGTISVTTLPDPEFTQPNQSITAQPGGNITVSANVGDAENAVQWRLFYIQKDERPSNTPDEYGTQIAAGSANVASATWFTAGVPLGEYEIGIFVTDSGQSIADTVASGNADEIRGPFFNDFVVTLSTESPEAIPPSVVVTQPASDRNVLVVNETDPDEGNVLVEFSVNVFQGPPSQQFVDVLYDFDGKANTGDEHIVSANLPITATNAVFRVASIDAGTTAFLAVRASDGVTSPVTQYAPGTVRRATFSETILDVTAPTTTEPYAPGDLVTARWTLNTPGVTDGTIALYFRRLGSDGAPIHSTLVADDVVTNGLPLSTRTFTFPATESGRFRITVFADLANTTQDLQGDGPVPVVVTSLPHIYWLGDLLATNNPLRGAIFGGVSFEDNAGSSFAGGEDFNDDGIDDFIIVSRYAKPDAINPSGIGIGEAYLIRGSNALAGKSFNLNTVSSATLPGMVFSGISITNPNESDETYGIASVFISSDADGDSVGEIWFGIPFANYKVTSLSQTLEREGMFVNGGVVTVSSRNSRVRGDRDTIGARILLDQVGMRFTVSDVRPEPRNDDGSENTDQASLCDGNTTWLEDRWHYYEGDCPTGQGQTTLPFRGCVDINDGLFGSATGDPGPESMVEPRHGFSPALANNYLAHREFRDGRPACRNTALTRDNECPSCFPADETSCNGTCVPWVEVDEAPAQDLASHRTIEPLDPSIEENQYCSAAEDMTVPGTSGPGTVDMPTLDQGESCTTIQDIVDATITNPAAILAIDDRLIDGYLENRIDGLARSPAFTGFYPDEYVDSENNIQRNMPVEPYGMRIIGRPPTGDAFAATHDDHQHEEFSLFGTSITQVANTMIISAPQRDAIDGFDADDFLTPDELENAGMGYTFENYAYWQDVISGGAVTITPPKPHMFLAGSGGVTGWNGSDGQVPPGSNTPRWDLAVNREFTVSNNPPNIVGGTDENIETIVDVGDFNGDTRLDFAVGSPQRNSGDGAVYVVFRRAQSLEGDFILEKLALSTTNAERLDGILVNGDSGSGEQFGRVLASGVDFNNDGVGDLIVGNSEADGGVGEVVIIFAQTGVITSTGGASIDTLLAAHQAARLTGSPLDVGSGFGFTVANAGDVDGDGKDDLLIAAPSATPRFDPDPSDATDQLTAFGLDRDRDGSQDDVTGPLGRPDGQVTEDDDLMHAGLVYVILSSTNAALWSGANGAFDISIDQLGTLQLPGYIIVGRDGVRTAQSGTVIDGDFLGGGNAADELQGGNSLKAPIAVVGGDRGRGLGLAASGDIDGDGIGDFLLGAQLADPRVNPQTGEGIRNGGEVYLIFGGAD